MPFRKFVFNDTPSTADEDVAISFATCELASGTAWLASPLAVR
jgi:hypothetical protein